MYISPLFFIDKEPEERLKKFGYSKLPLNRYHKVVDKEKKWRFHIKGYGYDWKKGYSFKIHFDDGFHKFGSLSGQKIKKEVTKLIKDNFDIDKLVEEVKKNESDNKSILKQKLPHGRS